MAVCSGAAYEGKGSGRTMWCKYLQSLFYLQSISKLSADEQIRKVNGIAHCQLQGIYTLYGKLRPCFYLSVLSQLILTGIASKADWSMLPGSNDSGVGSEARLRLFWHYRYQLNWITCGWFNRIHLARAHVLAAALGSSVVWASVQTRLVI